MEESDNNKTTNDGTWIPYMMNSGAEILNAEWLASQSH